MHVCSISTKKNHYNLSKTRQKLSTKQKSSRIFLWNHFFHLFFNCLTFKSTHFSCIFALIVFQNCNELTFLAFVHIFSGMKRNIKIKTILRRYDYVIYLEILAIFFFYSWWCWIWTWLNGLSKSMQYTAYYLICWCCCWFGCGSVLFWFWFCWYSLHLVFVWCSMQNRFRRIATRDRFFSSHSFVVRTLRSMTKHQQRAEKRCFCCCLCCFLFI